MQCLQLRSSSLFFSIEDLLQNAVQLYRVCYTLVMYAVL